MSEARKQLFPFVVFRNVMIVAGLGAAAGLCFWRVNREFPPPQDVAKVEPQSGSPIMLQAAQPPAPRLLQLNGPESLDSARGRSYLTGNDEAGEIKSPLQMLPIDRQYDHAVIELPELPMEERPPAQAPDEVRERDTVETPVVDREDLAQLPADARKYGEDAARLLEEGVKIQSSSKPDTPTYFENQARAAKLFREARDKLYQALEIAPDAPVLVDLMQQVKYALYNANKTGRK